MSGEQRLNYLMESIQTTIFQAVSEIKLDTIPKNEDLEHTKRLVDSVMENFYEYLDIDSKEHIYSKEWINRTTINHIGGEEYKKLVEDFQNLKRLKERVRVSLYGHISRHDLYDEWYEEMNMAVDSVMDEINKHFDRDNSSVASTLASETVEETSSNIRESNRSDKTRKVDGYKEPADVAQHKIRACIVNEFVRPIKSRLTLMNYGPDVTIVEDCIEKTTQSIIDYLRNAPFQKILDIGDSVCNYADDEEYPQPYI